MHVWFYSSPEKRPTSAQVCGHPFFWSTSRRLEFLVELSDRLEQETPDSLVMLALESSAADVVGRAWGRRIDSDVLDDVSKYRKYDESSVRELLRLIRNKKHHYHELSDAVKAGMGALPVGFCGYFEARFPKLFMHCVRVACIFLSVDTHLNPFCEVIAPVYKAHTSVQQALTVVESEEAVRMGTYSVVELGDAPNASNGNELFEDVPEDQSNLSVVVWHNSSLAQSYQCAGWWRDDQVWTSGVSRKRAQHFDKSLQDPRYRTQLCSHWVKSSAACAGSGGGMGVAGVGPSCPMRNKGKCIFAHGPVELRLKELRKDRNKKLLLPDAFGAAKDLLKKFGT
jgi:hypothetical protein